MNSSAAIALLALPVGLVLSAVSTVAVRRWSARHGFVDRPGGHKAHTGPVALGGGVAVTGAVVIPVLAGVLAARILHGTDTAWLPAWLVEHLGGIVAKTHVALGVVAAASVLCSLGLVDDRRPLGPGVKLLVEIAVAFCLVVGFDLRLLSHLGWASSTALSVLWIVTLINSLNFLDNMDGLAGGVALIAAGVFGAMALTAGQVFVPTLCWLLVGALAGFLPYNLPPATIYLGDAGSLVIGLLLAVLTILTTFADASQGQQPVGVIAPLVVMAVPLYDTASVVFLRWRLRQPIWKGDRRHFSHRLVRSGMSRRKAVAVIWMATLVTSLPALLLPRAGWYLAGGIAIQSLLVVALVAMLEGGRTED